MNKQDSFVEDNWTLDYMFTYSEEEKQEIEVAKGNSKLIYSPKFIPIYPSLLDTLTFTEALLLWFIDFYKSSSWWRMYFTNEQLWQLINSTPDTVSRSMSKLEKLWYIDVSRKVKAWGWQIRFINNCRLGIFPKSDLGFFPSKTRQNLQTNKNKINKNNNSLLSTSKDIDNKEINTTLQVDIKKENKNKESPAESCEKALKFWNEKFKMNSRLTDNLIEEFKKFSKKYTQEDFIHSLKNYVKYISENKWYTNRFSLYDFLKQKNWFIQYFNK